MGKLNKKLYATNSSELTKSFSIWSLRSECGEHCLSVEVDGIQAYVNSVPSVEYSDWSINIQPAGTGNYKITDNPLLVPGEQILKSTTSFTVPQGCTKILISQSTISRPIGYFYVTPLSTIKFTTEQVPMYTGTSVSGFAQQSSVYSVNDATKYILYTGGASTYIGTSTSPEIIYLYWMKFSWSNDINNYNGTMKGDLR